MVLYSWNIYRRTRYNMRAAMPFTTLHAPSAQAAHEMAWIMWRIPVDVELDRETYLKGGHNVA